MAKRKKRNALTLASLLLALIVLIGIYYWYMGYKAAQEAKENETTPSIDLVTIDTTQVSTLHVVMKDADLTLKLQGEEWISEAEPDRPINQDRVKTMLSAIDDINADRIIMEQPENLADYGLEEPAAFVTATLQDGSSVTVKIGNEAGDSDGYYGLVNEDGIVYLLPISLGTPFQYTLTQMTAVAEGPEITAENINHILVDNREGEDYELKYIDDAKLDNSGSSLYTWEILKPYGEGYTADSSKVSEIQANYTAFTYSECVDYKGTDLSKYGLDNPAATINVDYYITRTEQLETPETDPETGDEITEKTYNDPYEYKLYIGDKTEDEYYYVRAEGSPSIYTMSAANVEKMLTMDTFSILNPFVLIPNIESVDKIVCSIQGTEYTLEIKRSTAKNEDGEDETTAAYYYNSKEAEEDVFKELYQKLISPTYDAENKGDIKAKAVEPIMTISFHIFGEDERTVTASYLPYDESFYSVLKNDEIRFLIDRRKIDEISTAISVFTGKGE